MNAILVFDPANDLLFVQSNQLFRRKLLNYARLNKLLETSSGDDDDDDDADQSNHDHHATASSRQDWRHCKRRRRRRMRQRSKQTAAVSFENKCETKRSNDVSENSCRRRKQANVERTTIDDTSKCYLDILMLLLTPYVASLRLSNNLKLYSAYELDLPATNHDTTLQHKSKLHSSGGHMSMSQSGTCCGSDNDVNNATTNNINVNQNNHEHDDLLAKFMTSISISHECKEAPAVKSRSELIYGDNQRDDEAFKTPKNKQQLAQDVTSMLAAAAAANNNSNQLNAAKHHNDHLNNEQHHDKDNHQQLGEGSNFSAVQMPVECLQNCQVVFCELFDFIFIYMQELDSVSSFKMRLLQKRIDLFARLSMFFFGQALGSMRLKTTTTADNLIKQERESDDTTNSPDVQQAQLLRRVYKCWFENQFEAQFFLEASERLCVGSDIKHLCTDALRNVSIETRKSELASEHLKHFQTHQHALLFSSTKLVSRYSCLNSTQLSADDLILLVLLLKAFNEDHNNEQESDNDDDDDDDDGDQIHHDDCSKQQVSRQQSATSTMYRSHFECDRHTCEIQLRRHEESSVKKKTSKYCCCTSTCERNSSNTCKIPQQLLIFLSQDTQANKRTPHYHKPLAANKRHGIYSGSNNNNHSMPSIHHQLQHKFYTPHMVKFVALTRGVTLLLISELSSCSYLNYHLSRVHKILLEFNKNLLLSNLQQATSNSSCNSGGSGEQQQGDFCKKGQDDDDDGNIYLQQQVKEKEGRRQQQKQQKQKQQQQQQQQQRQRQQVGGLNKLPPFKANAAAATSLRLAELSRVNDCISAIKNYFYGLDLSAEWSSSSSSSSIAMASSKQQRRLRQNQIDDHAKHHSSDNDASDDHFIREGVALEPSDDEDADYQIGRNSALPQQSSSSSSFLSNFVAKYFTAASVATSATATTPLHKNDARCTNKIDDHDDDNEHAASWHTKDDRKDYDHVDQRRRRRLDRFNLNEVHVANNQRQDGDDDDDDDDDKPHLRPQTKFACHQLNKCQQPQRTGQINDDCNRDTSLLQSSDYNRSLNGFFGASNQSLSLAQSSSSSTVLLANACQPNLSEINQTAGHVHAIDVLHQLKNARLRQQQTVAMSNENDQQQQRRRRRRRIPLNIDSLDVNGQRLCRHLLRKLDEFARNNMQTYMRQTFGMNVDEHKREALMSSVCSIVRDSLSLFVFELSAQRLSTRTAYNNARHSAQQVDQIRRLIREQLCDYLDYLAVKAKCSVTLGAPLTHDMQAITGFVYVDRASQELIAAPTQRSLKLTCRELVEADFAGALERQNALERRRRRRSRYIKLVQSQDVNNNDNNNHSRTSLVHLQPSDSDESDSDHLLDEHDENDADNSDIEDDDQVEHKLTTSSTSTPTSEDSFDSVYDAKNGQFVSSTKVVLQESIATGSNKRTTRERRSSYFLGTSQDVLMPSNNMTGESSCSSSLATSSQQSMLISDRALNNSVNNRSLDYMNFMPLSKCLPNNNNNNLSEPKSLSTSTNFMTTTNENTSHDMSEDMINNQNNDHHQQQQHVDENLVKGFTSFIYNRLASGQVSSFSQAQGSHNLSYFIWFKQQQQQRTDSQPTNDRFHTSSSNNVDRIVKPDAMRRLATAQMLKQSCISLPNITCDNFFTNLTESLLGSQQQVLGSSNIIDQTSSSSPSSSSYSMTSSSTSLTSSIKKAKRVRVHCQLRELDPHTGRDLVRRHLTRVREEDEDEENEEELKFHSSGYISPSVNDLKFTDYIDQVLTANNEQDDFGSFLRRQMGSKTASKSAGDGLNKLHGDQTKKNNVNCYELFLFHDLNLIIHKNQITSEAQRLVHRLSLLGD